MGDGARLSRSTAADLTGTAAGHHGEAAELPSFVHKYQRGYISHADTKAFGVLAVGGSLVAYIESKGLIDVKPFLDEGRASESMRGPAPHCC